MAPPPIITGISPKEGPPGTRVTLRGEFLGTAPNDLVGLSICGCDCLLSGEWKSQNKIIARSGPGKGRGDIVVTTRSGGTGTSTVQFRGYHETIGPMKESAVWVEEAPLQTLAWGRRSLSPSSYQQEDPLGLSVEGNDKKFPEDDLIELFGDVGSGDLASEQFIPGWFLLEHHHATSFDDLKAGLSFLRRKVEGQKEGQLSFLKANVSSVMDQLDTLAILKDKFEADVKSHGMDPTGKVEKSINESMVEANKLFEEVLSRRDRADATRNALGVLQRFKFLFSLPVSIERNIKKGDYDVVINDYTRAKNLFGMTEVATFKKVLLEVEQRITKLQEILRNKLKDMPISLEEQKKIIRNLESLEASGDPAWEAVTCHSSYITQQLNACKDDHMAIEAANLEEMSKSFKSNIQSTPSNKHNKTPACNNTQVQDSWVNSIPQRVLFVEELTEIVRNRFPDFWKLGLSYFSGEFFVKVEPGKHAQIKRMVMQTIETFSMLLRCAVLPHTLDRLTAPQRQAFGAWPAAGMDGISPWLPHCLRYIRSTYTSLIRLDLPGEALDIIAKLIFDLRLHCVSTLFHQATEDIKSLDQKETWQVEINTKHGGITQLPQLFETKIQEVVELVKESVLIGEHRETPLLENIQAQRELISLLQAMLLCFVESLDKLAFSNEDSMHDDSSAVSQLIGNPTPYRGEESDDGHPIWEHRLLTTLGNCQYTLKLVLPRLSELFKRNRYPSTSLAISAASSALTALDRKILEAYLEHKSDPLVGTIEPSMYLGRFDWDNARRPTEVRPYAKELIVNVIGVHAEVHRISPPLLPRVLEQIVETVAEELSRLMSCVTKFNVAGNQQARADISAIREAVKVYTTKRAESFFEESMEAIPPLNNPADKKVVEDILASFQKRMHLQLMCFKSTKTKMANGVKS